MTDPEVMAPGVVLLTADVHEGHARVVYDVHGWTAELRSDLDAPWNGAGSLTLRVTDVPGVEASIETDGLTVEVLRALPLADARRRLTALKREHRGPSVDARAADRLGSPQAWAEFASLYVDLVTHGHRHPVDELATRLRMSRNTVSARVRRARERGFLIGAANKPATELGPEALKHLSQ